MKWYNKFSCLLLTLLISSQLLAQQNPPQPDEGMDIFLLTIATVVIGILCGAAIIGAFAAAMVIGIIAVFCSIGLITVSFLAGLYNRSLSYGFKTFVSLSLAGVGSLSGAIAGVVLQHFFLQEFSPTLLCGIGLIAGGIGGLILGLAAYKMIRSILAYLVKRIAG